MASTTTVVADSPGLGGAAIPRMVGARVRKMALLKMNITSYATDGESYAARATDLGFNEVTAVMVVNASGSTTAAYMFAVDLTAKKVIVFISTGAQMTSTTALDSLHLLLIGY